MGCSALGRHVCHIPSSKGSGIITGKGTESVRANGWVTIQEQCLLDTAGQLYMRTHSSCASMHKTLVSSSQTKPQQKERRRSWSPPWSERSTTIGNCRGRECQFSLELYYSLIESYISNNIWEAQIGLDGYYKKKEEDWKLDGCGRIVSWEQLG